MDEIINFLKEENNNDEEDDFFGFKASKKRVKALQEEKKAKDIESKIFYAVNRVFVNHGDSYHGKYIIQELNQTSLEEIELYNENNTLDEEFNEQNSINKNVQEIRIKSNQFSNSENCYKIESETQDYTRENKPKVKLLTYGVKSINYDVITTLKNKNMKNFKNYEYLKSLKKVIVPNNKIMLMNDIKKCSIVVFDISIDDTQIFEAKQSIKEILEVIDFVKDQPNSEIAKQNGIRVFILISSILTWAFTQKKNNINPITQNDYLKRIYHPNYKKFYDLENYILLLNDLYKGYFYGIILAPGIVYGQGEHALEYILSTAFNEKEQFMIPEINNNLPIIHVKNLARIVRNLVNHYDKIVQPYIIGVETSKFSLSNITEAIRDEVNKEEYIYCDYSCLFINKKVTQKIYDMITISLQVVPLIDDYIINILNLEELNLHKFNKAKQLITEYLIEQNLQAKKIVINGPYGTSDMSKKIAMIYNLDCIDISSLSEEFLFLKENEISNTASIINKKKCISNSTYTLNMDSRSNIKYDEIENINQDIHRIKEIIKEQKKYFKDHGQIDDKYLIPLIKQKLYSHKAKYRGYIISNYPETIKQAQVIFESKELNQSIKTYSDIFPTIIVNIVMTKTSIEQKNIHNEYLVSSLKENNWFTKDFKLNEEDILKFIRNQDNLEVWKNRDVVKYLELKYKPVVYNKCLTIDLNNPTLLASEDFDEVLESIKQNIPIDTGDKNYDIDDIKNMINKVNEVIKYDPIELLKNPNFDHKKNTKVEMVLK
ncbi:adenylate kinase 7-like [Daktulosphaira vitifoliae]|uniref:adenylate kinase 7-like n=1 Tax=Daktulosphaira vitifoliae TaxID=58002 RepID=UPI0021A999BF|nr:adenylate kinase 7-like [Daktulosphaira vitifoliae]